MVDDELKDTVAVRDAERDRVLAGLAGDGGQRGADVRVEHRELELEVLDAGEGLPRVEVRVVLGDVRLVSLGELVS